MLPVTNIMPARSGTPGAAGATRLSIHHRDDPGRSAVEAFIRQVYAARYGADVREFAPVLVATKSAGAISSAAGYRFASEPLFLERYLDAPVEQLLKTPHPVARPRIVEVGHLSASLPGEGRRLIVLLAAHLASRQAEWVVSTVTRELRQVLVRLGLGALAIAPARPDRPGIDGESWGSYYEHGPIVLAGHLPTALAGLQRGAEVVA